MQSLRAHVWLFALFPLLLAGILVMTTLTDSILWEDEGWTIAATNDPNPITIIQDWVAQDVHPPLYFFALSLWRTVTGDSVLELRYFSVLVSLIGVALVYRLGADLFNKRVALLAAIVYALHDQVKVLTQEVRHYPGQLTATALVIWVYWRFQQKPTLARGAVFVLCGVSALYIHYWTAFILLACGIHAVVTHYRNRHLLTRIIGASIMIGVLFAGWLPTLIHQITQERPYGLPHALENTNFVYRVLLYQLLGAPEVLWLVLIGAGLIGAWTLTPRRWLPSSPSLLLGLAVALPVVLSLLMNVAYPILSFRALAVIIAPVTVLIGVGLSRFRTPELIVMMAFIIGFSLTNTSADAIKRPDWLGQADTLTRQSTAQDVILLENYLGAHTLSYYVDGFDRGTDYAYTEHIRSYYQDDYPAYFDEALAEKDGIWVAKMDWPALSYDIRPDLIALGFVETLPEQTADDSLPVFLWRFDRLPAGEPIATFGDLLMLHRASSALNNDVLTVNLLWSATDAPEQDYTFSVILLGDTANHNHDQRPIIWTSQWTADNYYFDSHTFDLAEIPAGQYRVGVQVYWFTDGTYTQTDNLRADDCGDDELCRFIIVDEVIIPH